MAHLWHEGSDRLWKAVPLLDDACMVLTGEPTEPIRIPRSPHDHGAALMLTLQGEQKQWAVLPAPNRTLLVNGSSHPNLTGLHVLADRDELRINDDVCLYFSTESLAVVTPFPGMARRIVCPRCQQEVVKGDLAVQCPAQDCRRWYHESEELPCWTYADTCTHCPQSTVLGKGYSWTPEDL